MAGPTQGSHHVCAARTRGLFERAKQVVMDDALIAESVTTPPHEVSPDHRVDWIGESDILSPLLSLQTKSHHAHARLKNSMTTCDEDKYE